MDNLILEQGATPEEIKTAEHIVNLEKAALNLWFNGQTKGYSDLWSKESFSYFDGVVTKRIDSHKEIEETLKPIEGKLFAPDGYKFENPRV